VDVGEESSGVGLELGDGESITSVGAGGGVDAGLEGAGDASDTDALVVRAAGDDLGVGEGDARGTAAAAGGLVDVGGGEGGRLVLAAEVDQLDVVADDVELAVQAEVVVADGALETAGRGGAVDNLVGGGADAEAGGEGNQRLFAFPESILANADGEKRVGLSDGSSEAGSGEKSSGSEESGLHLDGVDLIE